MSAIRIAVAPFPDADGSDGAPPMRLRPRADWERSARAGGNTLGLTHVNRQNAKVMRRIVNQPGSTSPLTLPRRPLLGAGLALTFALSAIPLSAAFADYRESPMHAWP